MTQKIPQDAPRTGWEALYDFLNEIFAALIPGGFFLSYFFFAAFIVFKTMDTVNGFAAHMSGLLSLVITVVAYCFGALFQRREIKLVDTKSARHVYKKMPHSSGHTFAFANALTDDYVIRLVRILQLHALLEDRGVTVDEAFIQRCKERTNKNLNDTGEKTDGERKDIAMKTGEEILAALAVRLWDACGKDPKTALTTDEVYTVLRRLLILMPTEDVCAVKNNQTLDDKLKMINAARQALKEQPLKWVVEKALWDTISGMASAEPKTDGLFNGLLAEKKLRPFLKTTAGGGLKRRPKWLRWLPNAVYRKIAYNLSNNRKVLRALQHGLQDAPSGTSDQNIVLRRMETYLHADLEGTIDWPYTLMKKYCLDRGLHYAAHVNWGDGGAEISVLDEIGLTTDPCVSDEINRSKSRINTDKMDIAEKEPLLYRAVNKNEAHIRFMNSIWYATDILLKVTVWVIAAAFLVLKLPDIFPKYAYYTLTNLQFFYLEAFSIVYLLVCLYVKRSVLESFHYQRVRELNMILKAKSMIAEKENPTVKPEEKKKP